MAFYLVTAEPKPEKLGELEGRLRDDEFSHLRPFGRALTRGLRGARRQDEGTAVWEEEDYCSPPLAMERDAVLDEYFDSIMVEEVEAEDGWRRIEKLPILFRLGS